MIKEEYFAYSTKGGVRLKLIGDFSDLEDFELIRDYVRQMNAEIVWEESEDCSEQKIDI